VARYLDTDHGLLRVAPCDPFRDIAPRSIVVRWTPAVAEARGSEARYQGVVLTLKSSDAIRLYDARGLVAKLDMREVASVTEN